MGSLGVGGTTIDKETVATEAATMEIAAKEAVAAEASAMEVATVKAANAPHPVARMGPPPKKPMRAEALRQGKGPPEGA